MTASTAPPEGSLASEVIKRDGSIAIGQWGRDVTMTPDVVGAVAERLLFRCRGV